MSIKRFYFLLLLLLASGSIQLNAQTADSLFANYEFVINKDARITGINPAGLQFLPVVKLATASLQLNKADGEFKNYYQSNNSLAWGVATESYQRLNKNVVVFGKVGYHNFNGKQMAGSAFIDPYKNPFNLVENADTTAGTKKLESYNLTGAVSVSLSKKLNIGAKLNFNAANFAKTKDLRHTNKLLDMDVSAGLQYAITNKIQAGASYQYNRRTESISFQRFGNTDRPYLTLIDFGAFYGRVELFTESIGFTDAGSNQPLVNNTHSAGFQLNLQLKPQLQWYHEFNYGKRTGHYGEPGTASVVFTEHDAQVLQYNTTAIVRKGNNLHSIQLKTSFENLNNYENIYSRVTATNGASSIIYHGQSEVLQQYNTNLGIVYTLNKNIQHNNPQWIWKAMLHYFNRDITTTVYPFYRTQNFNSYSLGLMAQKNITHYNKIYSFSLGASYAGGNGTVQNDGVYVAPSPSQQLPRSRDIYLQQEYEYFTSPRITISPAVQLSMPVYKNINGYAKIGYNFTKAFNTMYTGSSFGNVEATVGCNF